MTTFAALPRILAPNATIAPYRVFPGAMIEPQIVFQPGSGRYFADHGWLKTYHSFSFARYVDHANMNWGALRVLNDDRVAPGSGFPTHPHENMEILTYVLDGRLEHRDTIGSHGIVGPGGVQFMSAGTGVSHSEYNASQRDELHFLQMWLIPGRQNSAPSYGQVDFTPADRHGRWLTVASGMPTLDAPIALTQNAALLVAEIADSALTYRFQPGRLGMLFVARGNATFTPSTGASMDPLALGTGDAVRLADMDGFDVAGSAELVFWDVPPLN